MPQSEKVLDVLQERGCVNMLFLAVFTYGRGDRRRQTHDQPLPNHGKQEYDLNFHGGNFATPHLQCYKNTVLKDTRAPAHGDPDLLADVPSLASSGLCFNHYAHDATNFFISGITVSITPTGCPNAAHDVDIDDQGCGTATEPRVHQLIRNP
jgi:hypothetical protein